MLKTSGGDEKAPEKDKKKERSGSIKKRLSIGYGFSSLRKRNPIKGVFEEEDKKKGKSIEIKVDDVGWKQTKHVGQEEAQQLKALMALTRQLGEEDTDDIVKLLAEWDKDKVQKEIDDKKRIQMQKNRSLQVVMEQWNIDPHQQQPSLSASGRSTPTTAKEKEERNERENTNGQADGGNEDENELTKKDKEKNEDDRTRKGREGKEEKEKETEKQKEEHNKEEEEEEEGREGEDEWNEDSVEDEFTGGSTIIDDDDEDLMEVAEIGSDEGSEGGRSPRSSFNERTPNKHHKKIREPRPPSMIFGKKENLDLRDWQTFLEAERARALPYASVASPRRTASPRNSPRNSPAGFLIFKQKKMLSLTNSGGSAAQPPPSSPTTSTPSSAGDPEMSGGDESNNNNKMKGDMKKKGGSGRRAWSDDDGLEGDQLMCAGHEDRTRRGEAVIELAEMSDGEEESDWRRATPRELVPPLPLQLPAPAAADASATPQSVTPTKSGAPSIPRIVLSPQDRSVKLQQPCQASPRQLTSPERHRKEQMRRISLSDSQLMFFQRWMRDTVKDGKVEVPADVEQEIKDHERESAKRYERMDADALRKALVKRDKEVAVLKRAVEDLKRREEKAALREKELREEVRREKERADRVQQRETVLKDLIREKVEEKRKMTQERDKERQKEEEKEKRKEKKEKKKSEKHEKKRKGSAIKFVSMEREKEKEREREKGVRERSRSAKERDVELMVGGGISGLERRTSEELATTLQEVGKGGTWSKSRGREVKIFKHLRSKSSEEVPTAYVAKDVRTESASAAIAAIPKS